jgi:short-subunit dehydrogenase
MKTTILTGTSGGLGKALFDCLQQERVYLICVSRRFLPYQREAAENNSDNTKLITCDLRNVKDLISGNGLSLYQRSFRKDGWAKKYIH